MPSKWKASQNLFLNKNDPFLHGSDCNFCNTIKYLYFMFIIYVWCMCIIQEYWWMTVHESVMEIQMWSIISGSWNMNLYELPMIFSNSYPVTYLVEWWNLSIYKGKTINYLTHSGRVTHICVEKLTIIGSDNGLSPGRRQAIIWTNAGLLLIGPLGTNFNESSIGIQIFSLKKMHFKMSSVKWRPSCLGLNVLTKLIHY